MRQIQAFNDVIRDCGFFEMQYIGLRFTWSRRNGAELTVERLDRGFANDTFRDKFAFLYEQQVQASFQIIHL